MSRLLPLPPGEADRLLGLTTTVPAEIIFAAGLQPLDLLPFRGDDFVEDGGH